MNDQERPIKTRLPTRPAPPPARPAYGTPPTVEPVPSLTPDAPLEPLPITPTSDRDRSWQGYEEVWEAARAETRREAEQAFATERARWRQLVGLLMIHEDYRTASHEAAIGRLMNALGVEP
ncbi:MAG TPA: hypothetical protein VFU98_19140 [Microlunatus sp.]|nr:hypothetical protein [Microlunatus sp.]